MNYRFLTTVLITFIYSTAFAQVSPMSLSSQPNPMSLSSQPNPMSLKECMEYAVNNSSKLKIEEANVDDARVARRDAILKAFTPAAEAGTYAYSNFGRSVDPETNTYVSTTHSITATLCR